MRTLIHCQELESSCGNQQNNQQKKSQQILSNTKRIIGKASLMVLAVVAFCSFSYAQVGTSGDITKRLRANYKHSINEVDKIPVGTLNEFAEDFNNVQNVFWKVESGYNEVDFTMNNKSMMAFFNYDDELIGSGHYVDYADLPEKGRARIEKDYADYTPEKAMFYEDDLDGDEDFLNFFGNFLEKDAYFVLLRKDDKEIVVQVTEGGGVSYFSKVR